MELPIIILFSVLIGFTFEWLFLLRNTVKKHDKHLLEMEWEFKHLKDVVNTNDKFVDKTYDGLVECSEHVRQLKKELQGLEDTQSKMADGLMKMNDLDKRISVLEKTSTINIPIQGQTFYPPCYFENGICTNPFHDCINCPRQFGSGGTITTTNVGTKSTDE